MTDELADLDAYWLAKGVDGVTSLAKKHKVKLKPVAAVDPIKDGVSLDLV